jgi:glutathione S-transferase
MAIVLHRFPISHFCEKVRAALDFKGLDYQVKNHEAGAGQIHIFRISGQPKLPVIEHDGTVVADSTEIALYLERTFPDHRRLLPLEPDKRREVLALEDRLDQVLGANGPLAWMRYALRDARFLDRIGAARMPLGRTWLSVMAAAVRRTDRVIAPVTRRFDIADQAVRDMLAELCRRLETSKYLAGDEPTLADVTAAGLTYAFKFPPSRYIEDPDLAGAFAPGIPDDPVLCRFFAWRDQFYRDYLR